MTEPVYRSFAKVDGQQYLIEVQRTSPTRYTAKGTYQGRNVVATASSLEDAPKEWSRAAKPPTYTPRIERG